MGSFGAHSLTPERIGEVAAQIRSRTPKPFAMNLWVSMEDDGARASDEAAFQRSASALAEYLEELGAPGPVLVEVQRDRAVLQPVDEDLHGSESPGMEGMTQA